MFLNLWKMEQLRSLLLGDSSLKDRPLEDIFLVRYLRSTNNNIDLAYQKIKNYYRFLEENPDWFASTAPLDKVEHIERNGRTMLQGRDKNGRQLYLIKLANIDINSSPREESQVDDMWFETVLDDPKTQESGISVILDLGQCPIQFVGWFTPSSLINTSKKIDICPCKEIVYHVVNTCILANIFQKLIWPFLNEKVKKSTIIHNDNWSSLHEYVSPDVLPPEYGGTGPEINFRKLNQRLYEQNAKIRENLKHRRMFQK